METNLPTPTTARVELLVNLPEGKTWGTIGMSECFVCLVLTIQGLYPMFSNVCRLFCRFSAVTWVIKGWGVNGNQRNFIQISLKSSLKLNLNCSDHVKTGVGMLDIVTIHTRSGKSRGYSPLVVQEVNGISRRTIDYSSFIFLSKNDDI